ADGVKQGPLPWASASFAKINAEQTLALDVTQLVNQQLAGRLENRGWLLYATDTTATSYFHSKDAALAAQRPLLIVNQGLPGEQSIQPLDDIQISTASSVPSQATAPTYTLSKAAKVALHFDLGSLPGSVASATLQLTTTAQQYGARSGGVGVVAVDISDKFAPIAEESGIAARYVNDAGLAADPAVMLFENFASLDMERHGWVYAAYLKRSIVGDHDPEYRAFKPLARGIKAYKMSIEAGKHGGDFGRWLFWSNLGHEPTEAYQRAYVFIPADFNSMSGKFPLGWDGTYADFKFLRTAAGKELANNPVTGRPWSRPGMPAAAGNGGKRSNGSNGWSARGGFAAQPCGATTCLPEATSPLYSSDYRPLHYYTYHADQVDFYGDEMAWRGGLLGIVPKNTWVCIDQYVKLNTLNPDGSGNRDGVLKTWIDGRLTLEVTNLRMRHWPGNFAGADNIKIFGSWLNFYHGGQTPAQSPMTLYMSDFVLAREFIGPGKFRQKD
ncbi:MAG: hypothetical protein JNJ60_22410, partial [Rhodocyclaceae bacterium]|nr:hypothetical protein [Rhodocyclaceae bacterium]